MKHRHLETTEYTLAAIDSVLEYGDLPDWRALFAAARRDPRLAAKVRHIAEHRPADGARALAIHLLRDSACNPQNPGGGTHSATGCGLGTARNESSRGA